MTIISFLNHALWNGPLLIILLGTHLFFTFRLKFIQSKLPLALKLSVTSKAGDQRSYTSLLTILAATLGTGNIAGLSTAVALGGPGAVFWCWLTGILGMATSYAECYLSISHKTVSDSGVIQGGPMYVWKNVLHMPAVGSLTAFLLVIVSLGAGCQTQANALAHAGSSLGFPELLCGLAAALIIALAFFLPGFSVSTLCTRIVPVMCTLFLGGIIFILCKNIIFIPSAITTIFEQAFSLKSFSSGLLGSSMMISARYGIARGLFTNEAGLGSAPVASVYTTGTPYHEALIMMTATFWDTVVICGITGIAIVTGLLSNPEIPMAYAITDYTLAIFEEIPFIGGIILNVCIIFFALATLAGWSFFGEKAAEYLFPDKGIILYRLVYIIMIITGSVLSVNLVWEICDLLNALMAIPNIICLFLLYKDIRSF